MYTFEHSKRQLNPDIFKLILYYIMDDCVTKL